MKKSLTRKGVIIDCDEDFMHSREKSGEEINLKRRAEWEIRHASLVSLENWRKYVEQSRKT